jgi:hypothetical protein
MIAFSTSLLTKGETDMGQWIYPSKSLKHTCIFEMERKGTVFTGEVVCTACGVYLSSKNLQSAQDKDTPTIENKDAI